VISVGRMAQLGEWYRFNNQGQAFPRANSFSPGCTVICARGMAQLGEWYRLKNKDNYSSMLGNNNPNSPWVMFYFLRVDDLSYLIDVSGRMAQMT
jgi:hypothetical protein